MNGIDEEKVKRAFYALSEHIDDNSTNIETLTELVAQQQKMIKVYPFVSKELVDKIIEDPTICQKIIEHERLMTIKLNKIVMEFFCSKEFLDKVFEGIKDIAKPTSSGDKA